VTGDPNTGTLSGKTALVTGGGSGVGAALALALARAGANLIIAGRRPGKLEEVAREARAIGVDARCCVADLSDHDDTYNLIREVTCPGARLDILVHNAAKFTRGTIEETPIGDLDAIYRTNIRAPFALTQALLPLLRTSRGQIVFINSSSGHTAKPTTAHYDASKHALNAMADSLRAEVNASGIRVLSVYPGRTASEMQAAVHAAEGKPYRPELLLQPEDVAAVVLNALTLPPTAEVTGIHIRPMQKS
jgi:short-subunit dehydrogenase